MIPLRQAVANKIAEFYGEFFSLVYIPTVLNGAGIILMSTTVISIYSILIQNGLRYKFCKALLLYRYDYYLSIFTHYIKNV